jgi:flavin-binding protein dodecin
LAPAPHLGKKLPELWSSELRKHCGSFELQEVVEQDLVITDGKVEAYRTKLNVSFRYEGQ